MKSSINVSKENNKEKECAKPNPIIDNIKSKYILSKIYDNVTMNPIPNVNVNHSFIQDNQINKNVNMTNNINNNVSQRLFNSQTYLTGIHIISHIYIFIYLIIMNK